MLMDEVYAGTLVQHKQVQRKLIDERPTRVPKDEWIRCENTHEAIISKEKWDIVQSMMDTIKHDITKEDEVTIFKGILKCGDCHHAMRKKWDKYDRVKSGDTAKYLYYNCATYRDYSQKLKNLGDNAPQCTSHYISDKVIRNIVIDDMNKMISQVKNLKELANKYQKFPSNKTNGIHKEIENKSRTIEEYKELLKIIRHKLYKGNITQEEYEIDVTEIKADIGSLEKEIELLRKSIPSVLTVFSNPWIQRLLKNGSIAELDRATVVEFIDKIYVYEDRHIEIVYKFSDEFEYLFAKSI